MSAAPGPAVPAPPRASVGSSFHYSFGLLPAERRRGIETVYAFCRAADDAADGGPPDPQRAAAEIARYRQEIARCFDGTPSLPLTRRLQQTVHRFGIPRRPFDDLLDGVEMDLRRTRYATFDELVVYCRRVASAVGHMCLPIFGAREPGSRDYADRLGIALQLTNILRDLRQDAERGRLYLPEEEMREFGYTEEALLRGERSDPFLRLMRHQAERARRQFDAAAAALPAADRPRLLAAEVMAAIYRRLLDRIERSGFEVFARRIRVPRLQQIGVALRARFTGRAGE